MNHSITYQILDYIVSLILLNLIYQFKNAHKVECSSWNKLSRRDNGQKDGKRDNGQKCADIMTGFKLQHNEKEPIAWVDSLS